MNIVIFTIRKSLLGDLLTQMEQLQLSRTLFGFRYFMTDPWPDDAPVRAWSLAVYRDDNEAEPPVFISSAPIIRAADGEDDYKRAGIVTYRYGVLDALRTLWEKTNPAAELLDLTVRVRDDVQVNTLEPLRLEPNTTLRREAIS